MASGDALLDDERAAFPARRAHRVVRARLARVVLVVLGILSAAHCSKDGTASSTRALPRGAHVLVQRAPATPFIERLAAEGRTRISRIARRVHELPPCPWLHGTSARADIADALEHLACVEGPPTALLTAIGDAQLLLVWPGDAERTTATGHFKPSGDLTLDIAPAEGFPWWLVPGPPPARAFLDDEQTLAMARWRAPRFELDEKSADLASISPTLAQALVDATLDGGYELAVYRPSTSLASFPLVLALSTTSETAARAGLVRIVDALALRYALSREDTRVGDDEAICVGAVAALPGLAPCGVVRDGFVVLAWDRATLGRALEARSANPPTPPATSTMRLDFDAIDAIDAALVQARAARDPSFGADPPPPSPTREIRVVGTSDGGRASVRVVVDLRDRREQAPGGAP